MMKTVLIKLGGSALENSATQRELANLVASLRAKGDRVVVVHGGGPAINRALVAEGISWNFVNGQRETTVKMMDVIEKVLGHDVNELVVNALRASDIPAVSLSGRSDGILFCERMNEELGMVGSIIDVNIAPIAAALKSGHVPVIAPLGMGDHGACFNVNADRAAARIAGALGSDRLVFLTDQEGVLDEKRRLVKKATPVDMRRMIESGCISGGMRVKVEAMVDALTEGVESIRVLHAQAASRINGRKQIGTTLLRTTHLQRSEYAS